MCVTQLDTTPNVYVFDGVVKQQLVIGILCEYPKEDPFSNATLRMQKLCGMQTPPRRRSWDQKTASIQKSSSEVQALAKLFQDVHDPKYKLWNFDVVDWKDGIMAVGIGSNTEKRKRAGNLALALTVALGESFENLSADFVQNWFTQDCQMVQKIVSPAQCLEAMVADSNDTFSQSRSNIECMPVNSDPVPKASLNLKRPASMSQPRDTARKMYKGAYVSSKSTAIRFSG